MAIVTLTTDFGTADGYVGVMKGVLLSRAPQARLVDLSHAIPPQDVRRAAILLQAAFPFFPPGTVHLAVVDPGVGTLRRPLALQVETSFCVGPDNGLFSYLLAEAESWSAVELTSPAHRLPHVSHTFHGRDIFSPAAAHLAAGGPLAALGPAVDDPVRLPLPRLDITDGQIEGEVLYADRFGNLITSIGRLFWEGEHLSLAPAFRPVREPLARFPAATAQVEIAGQRIDGVHLTYGLLPPGRLLAVVGSEGFLEVAVCQGDAAASLGVRPGDAVTLSLGPPRSLQTRR